MEKRLWFKRKRYGYGWTPSSWEGWAVTFSYIAIIYGLTLTVSENATDKEALLTLLLPMAVLTALLLRVVYDHGETPRWQWGKDSDKSK